MNKLIISLNMYVPKLILFTKIQIQKNIQDLSLHFYEKTK